MGEAAKVHSHSQAWVLKNFSNVSVKDNSIRGVVQNDEDVFQATANDEEYYSFTGIGGHRETIDLTTELLAASAVLNIKSVEPPDALKAYAEIYIDGVSRSFLGQPTTYAGVLDRLRKKYSFSQAEITAALRASISTAVDEEFNKISFLLEGSPNGSYYAVLTRDPKTGKYTLSYEGYFNGTKITKELTAPTQEALSREMRDGKSKSDFNKTTIDTVRSQAALIPAVARPAELNAVKQVITNFFTTPNSNTFKELANKNNYAIESFRLAYYRAIGALSADLVRKLLE
jgi:hypothetical protein